MGAKLGRRFLKQPAEKLKAVFVAFNYGNYTWLEFISNRMFWYRKEINTACSCSFTILCH